MCFVPQTYRHTYVYRNYLNIITNHLCAVGSNGLLTSKNENYSLTAARQPASVIQEPLKTGKEGVWR